MGYNIIDIINKAINIANKRKELYIKIGKEKSNISAMKILSKILIEQVDKTIMFYESLKKDIGDTEFEEIDLAVYDKISFIINEFNKKIFIKDVHNTKEFLELSLDLEKDVYSLLLDIQGRFVKDTSDVHTKTYKILSDIINNKKDHIETLKNTIK